MAYKDGETFTIYCDKDYDRHDYRLVFDNGKSIVFGDYGTVREYWYHYRTKAVRIEVLDKKAKPSAGKGF